jgi:hypothetical protein
VDRAAFRRFLERTQERLSTEPGVLGLVALGSTADLERPPDDGSDHDLWVVTESGRQEGLRNNVAWLPESHRIVHRFRETEHGVKVVYDDGHLVEFAVFALEELAVARANVYRVLFDRADVAARVAACAERSPSPAPDRTWLFGQALTHLLVAGQRWRRGERASASRFVTLAVERIAQLVDGLEPSADPRLRDDLDPLRRFERQHPVRGRAVAEALAAPGLEGMRRLLAVLDELAGDRSELPAAARAAVARVLRGSDPG